jgi:hypothetical protein
MQFPISADSSPVVFQASRKAPSPNDLTQYPINDADESLTELNNEGKHSKNSTNVKQAFKISSQSVINQNSEASGSAVTSTNIQQSRFYFYVYIN